ncbi:MAG: hypothetical protein HC896_01490 [Bacteroidales bacterium]|nr:hypothetical protein [Bacteroidales bacterium]
MAQASIWKLNYSYLILQTKDYERFNYSSLKKKYAVLHHISWNVNHYLNLNFFESVTWNHSDTAYNRGIEVNYLNPVIFFRPVEYSVGSSDNSLMGLGIKLRFAKRAFMYGQLLIDDFRFSEAKKRQGYWGTKTGSQLGLKSFHQVNNATLFWRVEYNQVHAFSYAHYDPLQVYGHYHQPWAHPLGANFKDVLVQGALTHKKIEHELFITYSNYASDSINTNFGGNIYKSDRTRTQDYGNYLLTGIPISLVAFQYQFNYSIIPKWSVEAFATACYRKEGAVQNFYLGLGIKTSFLQNKFLY